MCHSKENLRKDTSRGVSGGYVYPEGCIRRVCIPEGVYPEGKVFLIVPPIL